MAQGVDEVEQVRRVGRPRRLPRVHSVTWIHNSVGLYIYSGHLPGGPKTFAASGGKPFFVSEVASSAIFGVVTFSAVRVPYSHGDVG